MSRIGKLPITVPAGVTSAYVMVSGYTAATYTLDMDYIAP